MQCIQISACFPNIPLYTKTTSLNQLLLFGARNSAKTSLFAQGKGNESCSLRGKGEGNLLSTTRQIATVWKQCFLFKDSFCLPLIVLHLNVSRFQLKGNDHAGIIQEMMFVQSEWKSNFKAFPEISQSR